MSDTPLSGLRLLAEDSEDLEIVSAALQDALVKPSEIAIASRARELTAPVVRYRWEQGRRERVAAGLQIRGVLGARARGVTRDDETPLPLLALKFAPADEPPGGVITMCFAGGADLVVDVECIDVAIADVSHPWPTKARPRHRDGEGE